MSGLRYDFEDYFLRPRNGIGREGFFILSQVFEFFWGQGPGGKFC